MIQLCWGVDRLSNVFKLVPVNSNRQCLMLHPNQKKFLDEITRTTTLHFGLHEMEISCEYSNSLKENEIGLSRNIIEMMQLPAEIDYEVSFQKDGIVEIGPFIGVIIKDSTDFLNEKRRLRNRLIKQSSSIRGVVIVFSWEDMDQKNRKINGFIYNRNTGKWEEGTLPFPTVIVKRTRLSTKKTNYFKNLYGRRFFNSGSFNKWQMYQLLSSNKELLPHLPNTFLYEKPQDISYHLNCFQTIYVKPLSGLKGSRIAKFIKENDQYYVKFRIKNENKVIHFANEDELLHYVQSSFKSKKYIIQQELDLEIVNNHLIDFRIVLIKGQSGQWETAGMVGRKGVKGSVVSNRSSGGIVENGKTALISFYNLSEAEILSTYEKMTNIAMKAAEELDKYENIFKYGVDIGIDRDHHIWIIELNNRSPNDNIFSYIKAYKTIQKIKNSRMLYAKYLAGFPAENRQGDSE